MKEPLYIYLKTPFNEIVKQEMFHSTSAKEGIIRKWKALYGKRFNYLIIEEQAPPPKDYYVANKKRIPEYGKVIRSHHTPIRGENGLGLSNNNNR